MVQTSRSGMKYVAEFKNGRIEHKMDHLACFSGNQHKSYVLSFEHIYLIV